MATIREVAQMAGVSAATVSYVLNGTKKVSSEVEARVRAAAERVSYQPNAVARSLRRNRTSVIGVLVEDVRGMPVPDIVDGICEQLEGTEYQVLLSNLRLLQKLDNHFGEIGRYVGDINRSMSLLESARVDGVIYVAMHDRQITGVRPPVRVPMVYAYATSDSPGALSVIYDNRFSAREATRQLIDAGHRRIAVVAGPASSPVVSVRLTGFREAMEDAGLDVPADYIRLGDWTSESGCSACRELLSLPVPPTAVFFMNDMMASGGYHAAEERGLRVGRDLAFVGFDDRPFSKLMVPPLSTVELPNREIGHEAAQLLVRLIDGETGLPAGTVLPCRQVARESVCPVREG